MSFLSSIVARIKDAVSGAAFDGNIAGLQAALMPEQTSEVDNLRERYSAARYIEHMKAAMAGDFTGRREWARFINNLPEDERIRFNCEVDALIDEGALVHVLTSEQMADVRQAVLDKIEEYRAMGVGLMSDRGVDAATMHAITNGTYVDAEQEWPEDAEDEVDLEAWVEGDADE